MPPAQGRPADPGARLVNDAWIADRMRHIEASGIRKVFDLAKAMNDPINLSIGLPDFDVPDPVKAAAIEAIERGQNAYTVTQGIPELRGKLQAAVDDEFRHADRQVLITTGTPAALLLALCCVVNPGDEVIVFDPYFVMYRQPGRAGRRHVGARRHLPRLPDRRRAGRGRDHPADQVRPGQQPGQPDRRGRLGRRDARRWPSSAARRGRPADQRRGLPQPSATTAPSPRRPRGTTRSWSSTASASRTA